MNNILIDQSAVVALFDSISTIYYTLWIVPQIAIKEGFSKSEITGTVFGIYKVNNLIKSLIVIDHAALLFHLQRFNFGLKIMISK